MSGPDEPETVIATWFGAYRYRGTQPVAAYPVPHDAAAVVERRRLRRDGRLTPEEEQLLAEAAGQRLRSRDRRFAARGVEFRADGPDPRVPLPPGWAPTELRDSLLASGAEDLRASWDPSIHVEEAVRALADLDRALNLVAERLGSWAGREALGSAPQDGELTVPLAQAIERGQWTPQESLPGPDPALSEARRSLAHVFLEMRATRSALEASVERALPVRAANLSHLLGPNLAARLISQARGLDRLARMPASTVQVLGAEHAFFEHLRGRAPPPRHGLLFQHPTIQSAPRRQRGKLARALAGKAAIAARLDLAGTALDPTLKAQYERRTADVRAQAAREKAGGKRRLRAPLDRATEDR